MGSQQSKKSHEIPIGTGCTNPRINSCVVIKLSTIAVHVFFDGTRNNMFNSEAKRDSASKIKYIPGNISHENYYSNIALLFQALAVNNKSSHKIYVEGAGTTKGKEDSDVGLGTAKGRTGMYDRVEETFKKVDNLFKKLSVENKYFNIQRVIFHIYGFSRGAAWARYFCNQLKKHSDYKHAQINFVGLFDTVSSHGFFHYNDLIPLGLDIDKRHANYVCHLTAQNDYRHHFPLTPIYGAVKDNIGFECSLPGAHSDIGGGYFEPIDNGETGRVLKPEIGIPSGYIDYRWFMSKGYYQQQQLKISQVHIKAPLIGGGGLNNEKVEVIQRPVKFHYQFIGFELMKYIASVQGNYKVVANYNSVKHDSMRNLPKYLQEMKADTILNKFYLSCLKYIQNNCKKSGHHFAVPELAQQEMQYIYQHYIHNSLDYNKVANSGSKNSIGTQKSKGGYKIPQRPTVKLSQENDDMYIEHGGD